MTKNVVLKPMSEGGGRSTALGKLELCDNGLWGYFLGYDDHNRKILIKKQDLEKVLQSSFYEYTIRAEIVEAKERINAYGVVAKWLPAKLKEELTTN